MSKTAVPSWETCFSENFTKVFRIAFLQNISDPVSSDFGIVIEDYLVGDATKLDTCS